MKGLRNKRILVTGATGFIGANLVRGLLERGCRDISIFSRRSSDKWRLDGIRGSLRDCRVDITSRQQVYEAVRKLKPQVVFHCAVYGGFASENDRKLIIATNIKGTLNLISALSALPYDSLINLGSSSEYGLKSSAMKENDTLSPVDLYGFSKASASIFAQMTAYGSGKPITTVRPFSVYGPYESPRRLVPAVLSACVKNSELKINSPDSVRDFVHVYDVVELLIKVALKKKSFGALNIGCGRQYRVRELVETAISLSGADVRVFWGKAKPAKMEPHPWVADMRKVRRLFDWKPRVILKEGLLMTFDWMKNNLKYYS